MEADEFRRRGKEMIDYVADYLENIRDRRVFPKVQPGYIRELIPDQAPENGESWDNVFRDIERVIMPGVTHWQHSNFHAYYPSKTSYPAILGELLSASIGCVGFTWASSPACTELEVVVLDWLGKMLKLPEEFLSGSGGNGGCVIQSSACEATLVALLSARSREIFSYRLKHPDQQLDDGEIMSKCVAYSSDQSHSSVERAGLIASIKMRQLPTDVKNSLRGDTLQEAISTDRAQGLLPIFVCATLGTTSCCAFDNTQELGTVYSMSGFRSFTRTVSDLLQSARMYRIHALCAKEGIWMHIDAAYAGSAFICPEFRPLLDGVQHAESFNFNPHKWLNVNLDCSAMWVKNSDLISEAFNVDPLYLKHDNQGKMPDYRHWHIPLSRRFRSLKLWFVLRTYGQRGLQECIRKDVRLAHEFEELVKTDDRFEIIAKVVMGLVCFRLRRSNEVNEKLLKAVNADGRIHIVPAKVKGNYCLRLAICAPRTTSDDMIFAWKAIQEVTSDVLQLENE